MDPRRTLPSVDRVVSALAAEFPRIPRPLVADAARAAVESARRRGESGAAVEPEAVAAEARSRLTDLERSQLQPLVNATGVIIHTNLGRVPLGAETLEAVAAVAGAYSNLEYRLADGRRGGRRDHAGALLARACGAEAALVVNNNAAAVLVVLAVLARGRQVVVSRGQLVEIGGGFRVPEVLAESGATLVEVGTTNRTRLADYRRALGPETAMLLVVHPSNYRMVGFVESTPVSELAGLGPPVVVDAGSGLLDETTPWLGRRPRWLAGELGVRQCLDAGAALVTFSGDKLLGGPQAGVIAGRADLVDRCARHPLARAFRPGGLVLTALQQTALAYLHRDGDAIPFWRMAALPVEG
ncbi:MAG: L-seryl-tRNA(Sec) selenium transferase, partial [Acidimicrobiia bacterium]